MWNEFICRQDWFQKIQKNFRKMSEIRNIGPNDCDEKEWGLRYLELRLKEWIMFEELEWICKYMNMALGLEWIATNDRFIVTPTYFVSMKLFIVTPTYFVSMKLENSVSLQMSQSINCFFLFPNFPLTHFIPVFIPLRISNGMALKKLTLNLGTSPLS